MGDRYSDNVIGGLQNIYYILSVIGLVIMIIGFFGIEFNKLLTALSIVAAAIAIISKEIIADILCGISITFSRDIAIGDYVKIGEAKLCCIMMMTISYIYPTLKHIMTIL